MVLFGFHRMKDFAEWFSSVDKEHDGWLSEQELEEWLLRHHSDSKRAAAMRMQHVIDAGDGAWPCPQSEDLPSAEDSSCTSSSSSTKHAVTHPFPMGSKRLSAWPSFSDPADGNLPFVAQPLSQEEAQAAYDDTEQQIGTLRTELFACQEQLASQSASHEEALSAAQKRRMDSAAKNDEIKGELSNRVASLEDELQELRSGLEGEESRKEEQIVQVFRARRGSTFRHEEESKAHEAELQALRTEKDEAVLKQDEAEKVLLARVASLQAELAEAEEQRQEDLRRKEAKLAQVSRARRTSMMRHEEAASVQESELHRTEQEKMGLAREKEEAQAAATEAAAAEKAYTAKIDALKCELNQVEEEQEKSYRRQESKLAQMSRARKGSTIRHEGAASELAARVNALEEELAHARSVAVVAPVAVGEAMVRLPAGVLLTQRAHHVFARADKDSGGRLSKKEAKTVIAADESLMVLFGFHRMKDFAEWFSSVDKEHDGWLSEQELEEWLLRHHSDASRVGAMRLQLNE
jgi:Ca2+-binding EF-hand superfamily protein